MGLQRPLKLKQTKDKFWAKLFTRSPFLFDRWAQKADVLTFDESPWIPLEKPIADCRVALVTTGGVHMHHQNPFDMAIADGDPTYREIPADASTDELTITHDYYDHTDADKDINIILPVKILKLLAKFNEIGSIAPRHFSFMGHQARHQLDILTQKTAPQVAGALADDEVDLVILTPA